MKRLLILAAFLICSLLSTFAQFSGSGNGTVNDPYLIFNETQLAQVSNFLNQEGVVFRLMKDLDMTDWISENNPRQGWLPIGVQATPFMGKFLGNGHTISGVMINRPSSNYVGFFGYVSGAIIENLTIEGSSVTGASNVGGFIGFASDTKVTNCNLLLTSGVEGTTNVGGYIGQSNNTNFTTFSVEASVTGQSYLGGFVGLASGGTLQQGSVTGQRKGTGSNIGGFAGKMTNVESIDIKQKGNVNGQAFTGGFVGSCTGGTFTRCTVESNVQGSSYVSGFSGELVSTASSFNSCFHKGTITATGSYTGGIVGVSQGGCVNQMESCSHFGDIHGQNYVGGLIGATIDVSVSPTLSTYTVYSGKTSTDQPGGDLLQTTRETIVNGTSVTISINNCTSIGNINGSNFVGGLVGYEIPSSGYLKKSQKAVCTKILVKYLFKNGKYQGVWASKTDDLTYYYYEYSKNTASYALTNNYYSGTIRGEDNVGGLCGSKSGGTIVNNYSYANIYGTKYVGGIAGKVSGNVNSLTYNTTTIKSNVALNGTLSATTSNLGRIYGAAETTYTTIGALGSSEGNRALAQTRVILSGVVCELDDDLQNGQSIGPSALKLKANYVSWGWNFDENWNILETECFPYKKYQAAPPIIESNLVSQATSIAGKSVNGGTVYLYYKDRDAVSVESNNYKWEFGTEALQSGASVQIYADVEGMTPSYFTTATVEYPGSGTEDDPWRIYTADDLQGASNRGYYKLMNDIDLTQWINENNPTNGWVPIGRDSGEATYIDGDNHRVTGLWINSQENFSGLFSNFSAGQIKNLNVEVATGKKVKGGDYTGILIGRNANGSITNCTVKGDVEGTGHVGGVAGYAEATTVNIISYNGNVSSDAQNAYVGGVVGQMKNCTVNAVTFDGGVTSTAKSSRTGGISGQMNGCTVTSCNAATTISANGANSKVGGLTGESLVGSITKSIINVSLTAAGANDYVGGLVGYSTTPITLSTSTGNVAATGDDSYTGGLVGYTRALVQNCYSTANTTGTLFTAGLVGYTFSTINHCYSKGDINGVMYGGGVVGELDGSNASLTNSIAANNILSLSAQSSWGSRVIGGYKNGAADPDMSNYALNTMQVSLNNVPQRKTDDLVEGIAKSQADLMSAETYLGIGWDFSTVWGIDEGEIYPYLLWEIDVNPVADLSLDKPTLLIAVGNSETITANVLPMGATNKRLDWKSDNESVAIVENGVVTAIAIGTANITATTTDGSNISATCKVTVVANKDEAIAQLQAIVDEAQVLYDNSTEGENIGEYASGAREELLATITSVKAKISSTMDDETISECTIEINEAISLFESKKVTAGEDTDYSVMNNVIYLEKAEAAAGSQLQLSVKMKNNVEIQGFQFDLYLPTGVTIAKDEEGFAMSQLSTARTTARKTDYFDTSIIDDQTLRILCASTKGYTFSGEDGEVAIITLNIAEDVDEGELPLILKDIKISTPQTQVYATSYMKSTLLISSYTLGDVNADGSVDVADFIAIANHILGKTPEVFIEKAANVNQDNSIDVADIIGVANMILHGTLNAVQVRRLMQSSNLIYNAPSVTNEQDNLIYIEPVVADNGSRQILSIRMKNAKPVAGFEFSLYLPDGITVAKDEDDFNMVELSTARTTERHTNYFDSSVQADGSLKVLCGTTAENASTGSLYTFDGNDGEVARITVDIPEGYETGEYTIHIKNAILSDENAVKTELNDYDTTLTIEENDGRIHFDESSAVLPSYVAGDKGNVSMKRTIKAGEWSTIVLPFTLTKTKAESIFGNDVRLGEFDGFETIYSDEEDITPDAIKIHFSEYKMTAKKGITGGKPYLIQVSKDIENIEADDVTLFDMIADQTKTDEYDIAGKFTGTFIKTIIPENGLFLSENKFWYSVGKSNIKAFRCWFDLGVVLDKETDFGSKIAIVIDNEAVTSIDGAQLPRLSKAGAVYTINGLFVGNNVQLSKLPKGMYVVDGKKVVIK